MVFLPGLRFVIQSIAIKLNFYFRKQTKKNLDCYPAPKKCNLTTTKEILFFYKQVKETLEKTNRFEIIFKMIKKLLFEITTVSPASSSTRGVA